MVSADSVAVSIRHLSRSSPALRDLAADPVALLTARLVGIQPAFALALARDWLAAAERGAAARRPSGRDYHALSLIAQTLRVPIDYFLDQAAAQVSDRRHTADREFRRRNITVHGPCRVNSFTTSELVTIQARLQHELDRLSRVRRTPTGRGER